MNPLAWRHLRRWKHSQPPGDELFVEGESLSGKPDQWIKDGAPGHLMGVIEVIKVPRANGILSQDERAVMRVPNG